MLGRVEGEWNFAWISKHVAKAAKQVSHVCEKVYNTSNTSILLRLCDYRDTVMMLLALIDPSGSNCRIKHRLRRRVYHSEITSYYNIIPGLDR